MNKYCKRCEFLNECDAKTKKERRKCAVGTIVTSYILKTLIEAIASNEDKAKLNEFDFKDETT